MARVTGRAVITAAGVLVLAALLLPPWTADIAPTEARPGSMFVAPRSGTPGYRVAVGWHFVFAAPQSRSGVTVSIDWSRLALEILAITAAAALALYALPKERTST